MPCQPLDYIKHTTYKSLILTPTIKVLCQLCLCTHTSLLSTQHLQALSTQRVHALSTQHENTLSTQCVHALSTTQLHSAPTTNFPSLVQFHMINCDHRYNNYKVHLQADSVSAYSHNVHSQSHKVHIQST